MKINIKITEKFVPLFILLLCVLSYGSTLNLGYFWDDWFVLWNFHAMGSAGVFQSYAMDRPIHGYLLGHLMKLVGETPALWHLAVVLVLAANAILCWLVLRELWADHPVENALAAAFIAVYPGFSQQAMTLIYILQVFGGMCLWALSVWLMLMAYRAKRYRLLLIPLSAVLGFAHLAITEYFIGLEFLRPVLLALVISQATALDIKSEWRKWLKQTFFNWLPYLLVLMVYLFYRLVLFQSGRAATDSGSILQQIQADPWLELSRRVVLILTDLLKVSVLAWTQPFSTFFSAPLFSAVFWLCGEVSLIGMAFFYFIKKPELDSGSKRWARQVFWLGFAGILLAGLPFWGIGRGVTLGGLGDRYSFPFIFGSALVLVSFIFWITKKPLARLALAAVLIGLAVGSHFWNSLTIYQPDWANQQSFLSQLAWRVPGLQPGSSIWVAKDWSLLNMEGDYGLGMPVNIMYGPDQKSGDVSYWVFPLTDEFLDRTGIFRTVSGTIIHNHVRNVTFTGRARQTIVVWFAPQNCLKVIDPGQPELSQMYPIPAIASTLAHVEPIITTSKPAQFPQNLFGAQPKGWCYYFERADLARQSGDWQTAAQLGDEVIKKGLTTDNSTEWMPFIEAYLRVGRLKDAATLIKQVEDSPLVSSRLLICGFVERMRLGANNSTQKFLAGIGQPAGCAAP